MVPTFELFHRVVTPYQIAASVGLVVLLLYAIFRAKEEKLLDVEMILFWACALVFGILGAALLYQLTQIQELIRLLPTLFTDPQYFFSHATGGIVFYGGLLGGIFGCGVYAKMVRKDMKPYFRSFAATFALFHVFGRIGCFLTGCCHGMEHAQFGIPYTYSIVCENGIPYLPVTLYEAIGNFVLFLILHFTRKVPQNDMRAAGIYMVYYGTMRFILEFFRGDAIRGIYGLFSTSQWISLFVVPFGIYCLLVPVEKNILAMWLTGHPKKK